MGRQGCRPRLLARDCDAWRLGLLRQGVASDRQTTDDQNDETADQTTTQHVRLL
jgi:hypothetical protein